MRWKNRQDNNNVREVRMIVGKYTGYFFEGLSLKEWKEGI